MTPSWSSLIRSWSQVNNGYISWMIIYWPLQTELDRDGATRLTRVKTICNDIFHLTLSVVSFSLLFHNVLYNVPLHLFPFQCHCTVSIIGFCSLNYNTFSMVLYEGTKSILLFFSGSPLLRAISLQSDQRSNCLIFSYFIFHVFLLVLAEPEVDVHFPKPFALYNGRDLMANVLP